MAQHACKWKRSIFERPWQLYHKNSPWKRKGKPPKAAEWRRDKVWIKTCEECGHTSEVTGIPISSRRAGVFEADHDPLAMLTSEKRIEERLTMEIVLRELVRVAKKPSNEPAAQPDPEQRPEPVGSAAHSRLVNLTIGAGSDVLVLAYVIEKLLHAGLIQVEAKNVSKDEIDLQTNRVYLEAHALEPLSAYIAQQDQDETRQEAIGLLSAYFDTRPPSPSRWPADPRRSRELYKRLEECLRQQYNCLRTGLVARLHNPETGKEVANSENWGKYITLLRLLISLQRQLAHGQKMSELQFSFQVFGDSNLLPSFRREIEGLLDCRFRELNLECFTNLVYCAGPFRAIFERQPITGRSGFPFITLTEDTISGMRLTKLEAESILLIQHKACFEESLRHGLWQEAVVSILLDGYLATEQRHFLKKLLRRALPVRIWTDLDPIGLLVAEEVADYVEILGAESSLLFADPKLLEQGEELTANEEQELEAYCQKSEARYLKLAEKMLAEGRKFSQNQVLSLFSPGEILTTLQGGKPCGKLL